MDNNFPAMNNETALASQPAAPVALGALFILCVLLVALCAMLALHQQRTGAELLATRRDRDRLEHSIRHNLRGIRAHVAYLSPEACAVCDALETTLQARCRVDHGMLERRLMALRRAHNATLLDAAGRGDLNAVMSIATPWAKARVQAGFSALHQPATKAP